MTYVYTDFGLDKSGPQFADLDQWLTDWGFPSNRLLDDLKNRTQRWQLSLGYMGVGADGLLGPKQLVRIMAGPAPAPAPTPIDLKNWKWQGPLPLGGDSPIEVKQPALATYENPPYFDRLPVGISFRAPTNGAHTPNSSYPRSELREMIPIKWDTATGKHEMVIEQAITVLPAMKKHVVAGQIHDADDDVVMIRLEGPKLFVESRGEDIGLLDINYVLGTKFRITIRTDLNGVYVYYNGALKVMLREQFTGCYFKAGCYTQAYAGQSYNGGTVPNDTYGEVVIYSLAVTHT